MSKGLDVFESTAHKDIASQDSDITDYSKMKLLVVGGGMGGVAAIVGLRKKDKETEIVLVEPKDYCEICWASYRTPFDQKLAKSAMCPLDEFCEKNNVMHLQTMVSKLERDRAVLATGKVVAFDVCVVATGK